MLAPDSENARLFARLLVTLGDQVAHELGVVLKFLRAFAHAADLLDDETGESYAIVRIGRIHAGRPDTPRWVSLQGIGQRQQVCGIGRKQLDIAVFKAGRMGDEVP